MPREIKAPKVKRYITDQSFNNAILVEGRKQGMTIGIFVGGIIATIAFIFLSNL